MVPRPRASRCEGKSLSLLGAERGSLEIMGEPIGWGSVAPARDAEVRRRKAIYGVQVRMPQWQRVVFAHAFAESL